jgi:hypothetical protein
MANAKVYGINAWVEGFGQKIIINIEAMDHKGGRWSSKEHEIDMLKTIFKECEVFMEDF